MNELVLRKSTLYLAGIIMLIFAGGIFIFMNGNDYLDKNTSEEPIGAMQEVVISMREYNYYPNTITVKAGQPVRITLDASVYGCFRDFTIRELGIHQYLRTTEEAVEFTPTQPGRYTFACSMGMGVGTIIVE